MNMFKSDMVTIRKVQIRANVKCFEYFGQPTYTLKFFSQKCNPARLIDILAYQIGKSKQLHNKKTMARYIISV